MTVAAQPDRVKVRCAQCALELEVPAELAGRTHFCTECRDKARPAAPPPATASFALPELSLDTIREWNWLVAFPAAYLLASLAKRIPLAAMILGIVPVQFHELGHATASWLSGAFALPTFVGFTFGNGTRSPACVAVVAVALLAMGWAARREGCRFLVVVAGLLLAAQAALTFAQSDAHVPELVLLGGCGGELVLSALCAVSYFHKLPAVARWDYWRFPFLVFSLFSFEHSYTLWNEIAHQRRDLPLGTIFGGSGDAAGDLNRLMSQYGWTPASLTHTYGFLASACYLVIWGHYVAFALRAFQARRSA